MPVGAPREHNRLEVLQRIYAIMREGPAGGLWAACDQIKNEKDSRFDTLSAGTVYGWIQDEAKEGKCSELSDILTRAQEAWAYAQMAETIRIADDTSRDQNTITTEILDKETGEVLRRVVEQRSDNTAVNRDDKRIRARQWAMAKIAKKIFGDKIEQEITGKDGGQLSITVNVARKKQDEID